MAIAHITVIKAKVDWIWITKNTGEKLPISGGTYMIVKNAAMLAQKKYLTNSLKLENPLLL